MRGALPFALRPLGRRFGLTLIELLLVIGIIAVLAGITWAVFAPVREKVRQAICMGNLRQVWLALQAYRDDHDGLDPEEGVPRNAWELGLPNSISHLVELGYIKDVRVARCPNDLLLLTGKISKKYYVSYGRGWWWDTDPSPPTRRRPNFRDLVARWGTNLPAILDFHHDPNYELWRIPPDNRYFVLWVTFSGAVKKGWHSPP